MKNLRIQNFNFFNNLWFKLLLIFLIINSCNNTKVYEITNDKLFFLIEEYTYFLDKNKDIFSKKDYIILNIYPHKTLKNKFWINLNYNDIVNCEGYIGDIKINDYKILLIVNDISDKELYDNKLIKINDRTSCKISLSKNDDDILQELAFYNEGVSFSYIYDGNTFEKYTPKSKYWNPPMRE